MPCGADHQAHAVVEIEEIRLTGASLRSLPDECRASIVHEWHDEIFTGRTTEAIDKKEQLPRKGSCARLVPPVFYSELRRRRPLGPVEGDLRGSGGRPAPPWPVHEF